MEELESKTYDELLGILETIPRPVIEKLLVDNDYVVIRHLGYSRFIRSTALDISTTGKFKRLAASRPVLIRKLARYITTECGVEVNMHAVEAAIESFMKDNGYVLQSCPPDQKS